MKKKIIIIISVLLIVVVAGAGIYLFNRKENDNNQLNDDKQDFEITSSNINENLSSVSFYNMNLNDDSLDETQKAILKYFDNIEDYFSVPVDTLQRYPQLFEQAKIRTTGGVVKVLKSTNEEMELLVYEDEFGYYFGSSATDEYKLNSSNKGLCIIKGKQLEERILENDGVGIYGQYVGVETREIDGTSYTLPVINYTKIEKTDDSISTKDEANLIRKVAEHIFGKDVKITYQEGQSIPSYDINGEYSGEGISPSYYLATLDNQSNANFKAFQMSNGSITYDKDYNNLSETVEKKLFVSADFNHFIVTTYDSKLKYVYIDYFDKNLNKLWNREFEYTSNDVNNVSPMDYNQTQMAIVVDNDLYVIDLETGENLIDPVIVGFKTKAIMVSDGIILIGNENKDLIMKVDFNGRILYRIDGDTNLTQVDDIKTQVVNGKLVINVSGLNENADMDMLDDYQIEKYMVVNNDGSIEYSTKDISNYNG